MKRLILALALLAVAGSASARSYFAFVPYEEGAEYPRFVVVLDRNSKCRLFDLTPEQYVEADAAGVGQGVVLRQDSPTTETTLHARLCYEAAPDHMIVIMENGQGVPLGWETFVYGEHTEVTR